MTANEILRFIKEQRHIFGICPCCNAVFRLSDVRISYKGKYAHDWLDAIEIKEQKLASAQDRFDEKKQSIKKRLIEMAKRKLLPKILNRAVPFFTKQGINPEDIKTILHPIDFVAFNGMNADKVENILLMDWYKEDIAHKKIQHSITEAIKNGSLAWQTLKVTEDGMVEVEE